MVSVIGLRQLEQEGIQELKLDQQFAVTARTYTIVLPTFLKQLKVLKEDGVNALPLVARASTEIKMPQTSTPPVEVSKTEWGLPASIDSVISSDSWTKSMEVPSEENGVIKHDAPSDLR